MTCLTLSLYLFCLCAGDSPGDQTSSVLPFQTRRLRLHQHPSDSKVWVASVHHQQRSRAVRYSSVIVLLHLIVLWCSAQIMSLLHSAEAGFLLLQCEDPQFGFNVNITLCWAARILKVTDINTVRSRSDKYVQMSYRVRQVSWSPWKQQPAPSQTWWRSPYRGANIQQLIFFLVRTCVKDTSGWVCVSCCSLIVKSLARDVL